MTECPNCKQPIFENDIYCGNCGSDLQGLPGTSLETGGGHLIECPACGAMNEPDAIYCEKDGTPLKAGPSSLAAPEAIPEGEHVGVLILPDQTVLSLTQPNRTFGRSDLLRFLREDQAQEVSRSHFTITQEGGAYYIEDGGPDPSNPQAWKPSVNRTIVNGVTLQPSERLQLKPTDVIDVAGLVRLTFKTH